MLELGSDAPSDSFEYYYRDTLLNYYFNLEMEARKFKNPQLMKNLQIHLIGIINCIDIKKAFQFHPNRPFSSQQYVMDLENLTEKELTQNIQ